MRREDRRGAGEASGARVATLPTGVWRPGVLEEGLLSASAEPHRGVLTSGAADQLAALVARAAGAPAGLIHFLQGTRLRLYGGWGLSLPWDAVADTPVGHSPAGIVVRTDAPLVIRDML